MSERWSPKKLLRERIVKGISLDGLRRMEIERLEAQNVRSVQAKMRGNPVVMNCNHGSPWTTCSICSKPVTKR